MLPIEEAMATKTTTKPAPAQNREASEDAEPIQIVVRRGAARRYDLMKKKSADLPVNVTWDRRVADRRAATEAPGTDRRRKERRKEAPFTWDMADFVIVESPAAEDARLSDAARKKKR